MLFWNGSIYLTSHWELLLKELLLGKKILSFKDYRHFSNDNFITVVKVKNIVNFLKHKRIQKIGNLGNWKTSGKSEEILKW